MPCRGPSRACEAVTARGSGGHWGQKRRGQRERAAGGASEQEKPRERARWEGRGRGEGGRREPEYTSGDCELKATRAATAGAAAQPQPTADSWGAPRGGNTARRRTAAPCKPSGGAHPRRERRLYGGADPLQRPAHGASAGGRARRVGRGRWWQRPRVVEVRHRGCWVTRATRGSLNGYACARQYSHSIAGVGSGATPRSRERITRLAAKLRRTLAPRVAS